MKISLRIRKIIFNILLIGSLTSFSQNSLASQNCETSFILRSSSGSSHAINFPLLINKVYTKRKLDEILKKLQTADRSAPDGATYDSRFELVELKEDEGIYGRPFVNDVISFDNLPMVAGKFTRYEELVPLMKARLRAYECHQSAGWPSAIDYATSAQRNNPLNRGSEAVVQNSAQKNHPSSSDGTQTPGGAEAQMQNCRHGADEKGLKASDRIRFMKACMDAAASERDVSISAESQEKIAAQTRMSSNDQKTANSLAINAQPGDRKIYFANLGAKCLRTVDIREDVDVRGMFWFTLQNICNEPIKAYWCDLKVCRSTNMSWILGPGEKEISWTSVRSGHGRHPRDLKGFACPVEYNGAPVHLDQKSHKCYAWYSMTGRSENRK